MALIIAQSTGDKRTLALYLEDEVLARELTRRISKMTLHSGLLVSAIMDEEEINHYEVHRFYRDSDAFFGAVIDMAEGLW